MNNIIFGVGGNVSCEKGECNQTIFYQFIYLSKRSFTFYHAFVCRFIFYGRVVSIQKL